MNIFTQRHPHSIDLNAGIAATQTSATPRLLIHPKYRPDINGLRAVAVLAVVIFHAFPKRLPGGFVGVDVFFVISGFLISTIIISSLEQNKFSFAEFYARRVKRIFPALFIVLCACFAYGWFWLLADDYKQLGEQIAGGAGFISNLILWNESGYFDTASSTKPLLHLWSLGIEEQFYIVWPFLLWGAWKKRLNLLTLTLAVGIVSFVLNVEHAGADAVGTFYSPQTRFWELLVGAMLAWLQLHPPASLKVAAARLEDLLAKVIYSSPAPPQAHLLDDVQSLTGAAMVAWAVVSITSDNALPGWWALLPTLGAALLISAGSRAWINRTILSHPFMVWVGLISFPLYLWHWPLLAFARIIHGDEPTVVVRLAAIAIAFGLAWLTYALVENPIRKNAHSRTKVGVLVVLMATIGYEGLNSYQTNGHLSRKIIRDQVKLVSDLSKITSVNEYYEQPKNWRSGTCWGPKQGLTLENLLNTCVDEQRPLVFLFGDSYSAVLYSGLTALQKDGGTPFGIAQLTNSNGPPFFDDTKRSTDWPSNNRTLADINEEKLRAVAETRPALVLISWMYDGLNGILDKQKAVDAIHYTVTRIHEASPQTKVLVVGPLPKWSGNLKDVIVSYAHDHRGVLPPQYTDYKLRPEPKEWDDFLKVALPARGIDYVSAQDALCNQRGCITRFADDPHQLSTIDYGHLTAPGSTYLISRIKGRILADLK